MKSYVIVVALLQVLGCSGIPTYNSELESTAGRGLGAALTQVNSVYAVNNLYRPTRATVKRVIPVGLNIVDLMIKFDIKETECAKISRSDPQTCAFKPGFFVPSYSCLSRVRMSATSAQVVSLRCGHDGSSSSESSEEIFSRGRNQFNIPLVNRVPAPSAAPPPVQPDGLQTMEIRQRGDNFDNFLV